MTAAGSELPPFKAAYARNEEQRLGTADVARARVSLEQAVAVAKPTILIATSASPGTFSEGIIRAVAGLNEFPIILPIPNPTSKSEYTPEEALR